MWVYDLGVPPPRERWLPGAWVLVLSASRRGRQKPSKATGES